MIAATAHRSEERPMTPQPIALRILSLIFYAGFAIPVSIVAIAHFWPAGMVLAAFLAYQWTAIIGLERGTPVEQAVEALRHRAAPDPAPKSSGNASFDAYRAELLARLEQEQDNFEGFLTRLRAAKDKGEFDDFMEARARRARQQAPDA